MNFNPIKPIYFDFASLEYRAEVAEMFLMVAAVYILIFTVSWVYIRLGR